MTALEDEIDRVGADKVAAFVYEPVIGSGGVLPPPDGYLEGAAELCRTRWSARCAAAVGLEPELLRERPDSPARLGSLAREAGLLTRGLRDGVALAPPLTIEDGHLELAVAALQTALDQLDQWSVSPT